jgi:hypothetical protein
MSPRIHKHYILEPRADASEGRRQVYLRNLWQNLGSQEEFFHPYTGEGISNLGNLASTSRENDLRTPTMGPRTIRETVGMRLPPITGNASVRGGGTIMR